MDEIKIEQAKSDYQKIVSFIEDGSPLPPETDPYWEVCSALDRLGGFIADIERAKNTEQQLQLENVLPVCWNESCPMWNEDICQSPGKCIEDVSG